MTEKIEVKHNDQIVLTRVSASKPVFSVHRSRPGGGYNAISGFTGTFDEAVQYIRDHYVIE